MSALPHSKQASVDRQQYEMTLIIVTKFIKAKLNEQPRGKKMSKADTAFLQKMYRYLAKLEAEIKSKYAEPSTYWNPREGK